MKTTLITLIIVMTLTVSLTSSNAEIKNGYSRGILDAQESLKNLKALLTNGEEISSKERRTIETRIKLVENYIVYHQLTESLLARFRMIAPDLYNQVDTIADRQGRPVDVFVKFITGGTSSRVQAWGITNIAHVPGDEDGYVSEFGPNTVSIEVWAVEKSLLVLAHELGHVAYQVPSLAAYTKYHKETYRPGTMDPNHVGHGLGDPSGERAEQFAVIFKGHQVKFLRAGNDLGASPTTLREIIRKEIQAAPVVLTGL